MQFELPDLYCFSIRETQYLISQFHTLPLDMLDVICNNLLCRGSSYPGIYFNTNKLENNKMSLDLDAFINKAVSQVRDSKKTGKKGRSARKNLKQGEAELAKIKQTIRDTALACKQRAWKDIKLTVRRYETTCSCCGSIEDCDVIYLERHHKKAGILIQRLDEVQVYSFPSLPRTLELHDGGKNVCGSCFTNYTPEPIWAGYSEPHPREFERLTAWQEKYKIFSEEYDRRESWKEWKETYLPKTLLLEHLI